jgi:hypothetical protein
MFYSFRASLVGYRAPANNIDFREPQQARMGVAVTVQVGTRETPCSEVRLSQPSTKHAALHGLIVLICQHRDEALESSDMGQRSVSPASHPHGKARQS